MKKLILIVPFLLLGCSTVNTDPVITYSETISTAQVGFRKVFNANYSMVKSAYANEYASNEKNNFYNLVLVNSGGFYDFDANSGSILNAIKKEKFLLDSLNVTMIEYARVLELLAGCDADALVAAWDLNNSTKALLSSQKTLKITAKYDVFSGAFLAAADLYVENKRIECFRDAVTNNQQNIEQYSQICITLLHMMRDDIFRYYASVAEPLRDQFEMDNYAMKTGSIVQMVELNDRISNCLEIMKRMEEVYKLLPKAHLEMAEATKLPPVIEFFWGPKVNDLGNINKLNSYKNSIKLLLQ